MKNSLVSIIMPCYNCGKFIEEAIVSVINQSYKNWELLIINDGSTDDTELIVNKFLSSKIKYFTQANKGVSAARNVGLNNMTGDFYCFLDADDIMSVNSIQARIEKFTDDNIKFVDGHILSYPSLLKRHTPNVKGGLKQHLVNVDSNVFFGPSYLIKRDPTIKYAFDEELKYCEDLLFYITYSNEYHINYTDEIILYYRVHENSAMHNIQKLISGYFLFLKKAKQLLSFKEYLILNLKVRIIVFKIIIGYKKFNLLPDILLK
jgi:glycosyltransferase involved in cell wall biosynthesis